MVDMAMLDNLRHGVPVLSTDGYEVGKLHAVLLDERDERVTRIVVNAGPHFPSPGFGAPSLVAVPEEEVADAGEDAVLLKCTAARFDEMPPYAEYRFASDQGPRRIEAGRGSIADTAAAIANSLSSIVGLAVPVESFRRAKFERGLFNDAPVWREDPHEKIGEVERVLVDESDEEIEALVVRRGELMAENVILPIDYVTEVFGGIVRVQLTDEDLDRLEVLKAG
jgi:sporulation protein YlmC with PRC-barrel domain